jgi:hypothetical protein
VVSAGPGPLTAAAPPRPGSGPPDAQAGALRRRFPPRPDLDAWPQTRLARADLDGLLAAAPFTVAGQAGEQNRRRGIGIVLDWLQAQPGATWQQRWQASGAGQDGRADWRAFPLRWRTAAMRPATGWDGRVVTTGLLSLICTGVIRPGISWLLTTATPKRLAAEMARTRDPAGLTGLAARCDASPVGEATTRVALHRVAVIMAAKGGTVADIGRPDQVALVFDRRIQRGRKHPTPGRFRTRVITSGVVPSLHIDYKHSKIKQYHKLGRAIRTETTINDAPADFGIPKRLTSLPDLRQIGFTANRRLLGVQTISHDPIHGAQAFSALTAPIVMPSGTRIPALRFGDPRVHALLQALLIHRLLPRGFTNRELRTLVAPLLGKTPEDITAGKMTYDLRRLREHGLIARIPHTRRYQVTDTGLHDALLFTHAHDHLLRPGLAQLTDPSPPAPSRLRAAARAYQAAYDDLARQAHLAA